MNKIKLINIFNLMFLIILIIILLSLGIIYKFNYQFYLIFTIMLMISGIGNLIFVLIKEALIVEYKSLRFIPALYSIHTFLGVVSYYIAKYVKQYEKFSFIYWIILLILFIASFIFIYFLEKKAKKNNNNSTQGPKIMVNKK